MTWARRLNTINTYLPVYVGSSIQMVFPESPASSADDEVDLLGLGSTVTSEEFLQYRFSWLLSSAINVWLFLVIKYKVTYTKIRKYEIVCIKSMIIKLHLYRNKMI